MIVKFNQCKKIKLPDQCVLCLEKASQKDFTIIGDQPISYCQKCYQKVERLRRWKDRIFFISLIFGLLGTILAIIARIAQEGAISLLTGSLWFATFTSGFIFMAIVYLLLKLLLLPFLLIFRSKFNTPGVKILKSKEPNIVYIKFNNNDYAKKFCQLNHLDIQK